MNKTIGILAHVDAGKTTLSEQILFHCGALRRPGRVDHRDAFLDFDPIERRRGITIFSEQASFELGDSRFFLVDTPGHADFSPEMERCLDILDYAIVVVSCTSGVQAHTETIWRLLEERRIPAFFFLNKTDCPGANAAATAEEIRQRLTPDICLMDEGFTNDVVEQIALTDDDAVECFLERGFDRDVWYGAIRRSVRRRALFPAFSGSALSDIGVAEFLESLDSMTDSFYSDSAPFSARVYKIRHDRQNNRVAYMKILSGVLRAKDMVGGEKVNELRMYSGEKHSVVQQVNAGCLCAVTGLSLVRAGDTVGNEPSRSKSSLIPLMTSSVKAHGCTPGRALELLRIMEDEEPALHVRWDSSLEQLSIAVMGEVQLEVLRETAQQRFGLELEFGQCRVLYKETIHGAVLGSGHFEPLRHYAEVHFKIEAAPRGSGISYACAVSGDALATNWQRLIKTHVFEKEHLGPLTGSPLTDVKITLVAGRAHEKHTEGGDFREATYRAIRHGLFHAQGVLLEPWYSFRITAAPELAGRIIADVRRMCGTTDPPETYGALSLVRGRCPVSEMAAYARGFASLTRGRGSISAVFDGYEECHNSQEVIESIGYDRERDVENTADSVFCSHGAGFTVKWYDAGRFMHCIR